ncbi:MAG: PKD domain-containing protein [Flavobacteriales bacterium]|nr:PKD domain-containing protein [Flavobacteriales bacterium]
MKSAIRSMALASALCSGILAIAQQYTVILSGTVSGCSANSYVNIESMPATLPAINIDVPLLPPDCSFSVALSVISAGGGFNVSTLCNGAIQSQVMQYQINPLLGDSTAVSVTFNCGGNTPDCTGTIGGSALPGTPCTGLAGEPGIWNSQCQCIFTNGDCAACFTVSQVTDGNGAPIPYMVAFSNCSTDGEEPIDYFWDFPSMGVNAFETTYTYPGPGGGIACLSMLANGCTSSICDTVLFDANGVLVTGPAAFDCLLIVNGGNLPGTPCTTPFGTQGTWDVTCMCMENEPTCNACVQLVQATDPLSGQPIPWALEAINCSTGGSSSVNYSFSWNTGETTQSITATTPGEHLVCLHMSDTNGCLAYACDSVILGPDGLIDTPNCQAGFWVIQAYEFDTINPNGGPVPIPYELWVWNLSTGTSPFQFEWDFGDGTSSTEAYPTHVYGNSGPYLLCLTMSDAASCTSSYCDSVSIDGDGFYEGMVLESVVRSGFTIRVLNQLPTAIEEQSFFEQRLWPNPVSENMSLSFRSTVSGTVPMSIIDLNGRVLQQDQFAVVHGDNRIDLSASHLVPGMYVLRIGNDTNAMNIRFVKH